MSLLAATRIVLIHPSLPENVGAVARGMRHFGFQDLVLVGGVAPMHSLAIAASAGNEAILARARVVETLEEALEQTVLAMGTTARSNAERQPILPEAGARLAKAHAMGGPVALVFGTEKDGMRTEELRRCHQIVTIPGEAHACLNLAQAFTVLAYVWHMADREPPADLTPLLVNQPGLDQAIAEALDHAGLLKPHQRDSKLHTLRRILSRVNLTPDEAAMLRGLARGYRSRAPRSVVPPARGFASEDTTPPS